jgi:hypothetical protein
MLTISTKTCLNFSYKINLFNFEFLLFINKKKITVSLYDSFFLSKNVQTML